MLEISYKLMILKNLTSVDVASTLFALLQHKHLMV